MRRANSVSRARVKSSWSSMLGTRRDKSPVLMNDSGNVEMSHFGTGGNGNLVILINSSYDLRQRRQKIFFSSSSDAIDDPSLLVGTCIDAKIFCSCQ